MIIMYKTFILGYNVLNIFKMFKYFKMKFVKLQLKLNLNYISYISDKS